jgi:hypothetical protein
MTYPGPAASESNAGAIQLWIICPVDDLSKGRVPELTPF